MVADVVVLFGDLLVDEAFIEPFFAAEERVSHYIASIIDKRALLQVILHIPNLSQLPFHTLLMTDFMKNIIIPVFVNRIHFHYLADPSHDLLAFGPWLFCLFFPDEVGVDFLGLAGAADASVAPGELLAVSLAACLFQTRFELSGLWRFLRSHPPR